MRGSPPPPVAPLRRIIAQSCLWAAGCLVALTLSWPLWAQDMPDPGHTCLRAAERAARAHDVPLDVLKTIALVETGRQRDGQMLPWPWAIHSAGQGHWAASRDDALAIVRAALADGRRNIDLGCFQINYHWHAAEFADLEQMIDPDRNADYAARLLRSHYDRLGSWDLAAGAYHSATPDLAARYRARFAQLLGRASELMLAALPSSLPVAPPRRVRENRFPLLLASDDGPLTQAGGSIVPLGALAGHARPLFED